MGSLNTCLNRGDRTRSSIARSVFPGLRHSLTSLVSMSLHNSVSLPRPAKLSSGNTFSMTSKIRLGYSNDSLVTKCLRCGALNSSSIRATSPNLSNGCSNCRDASRSLTRLYPFSRLSNPGVDKISRNSSEAYSRSCGRLCRRSVAINQTFPTLELASTASEYILNRAGLPYLVKLPPARSMLRLPKFIKIPPSTA